MCFSATASFTAAAVCGAAGVAAVRHAARRDLMLAFVPVLFGAQQAFEGVIWLTQGEGVGQCAAYGFAIIAYCLWAAYIPLAAWLSEIDPRRRALMLPFILLGTAIGVIAAVDLCFGLTVDFELHHIRYGPVRNYPLIIDYLYGLAVIGPLFIYRNVYLRIFSCLNVIFFAVSMLYFNPVRYSVWCFFAALSSLVLYLFIASRRQPRGNSSRTSGRSPLMISG